MAGLKILMQLINKRVAGFETLQPHTDANFTTNIKCTRNETLLRRSRADGR